MPAAPSHTQSRTWVNPAFKNRESLKKLNDARRKLCPRSTIFHQDFDLAKHRLDIADDHRQNQKRILQLEIEERVKRQRLRKFDGQRPAVSIAPAFGAREFGDNRASVLAVETVFSPQYFLRYLHHPDTPFWDRQVPVAPTTAYTKELADWPSRAEFKYEGDERIATDLLHARFAPAPRMSGNDTVGWMQRTMLEAYPLENFYPRYHWDPSSWEVEIFLRTHVIADFEVGPVSDEGAVLISSDLMDELGS